MTIKLVSCSCVDNMQYYDAVVCLHNIEFTITCVYYDVVYHRWSVKVPSKPLFETYQFADLMSFISSYIYELFYR